jgi:general secretion pathway protein G
METHRRRPGGTEGFTLIELLVVISLVMILSSVAMVSYRQTVIRAKEAALMSDLYIMRDAINQYYADKGKYPDSLQALVAETYLRAMPKDQFTNSRETWVTTQAEAQPGSNTTSNGIYYVKSGSEMTAIDGSRYADW